MIHLVRLAVLALTVVLPLQAAHAFVVWTHRPDPLSDLPASAREKIVAAAQARASQTPSFGDDVWSTAHDCLFAAASTRLGLAHATATVSAAAEHLVALAFRRQDGTLVWGLSQEPDRPRCDRPGSFDAFQDGTCNPPETGYAFQSSFAIGCLAQAAALTASDRYAALARQSMAYWERFATTPADCLACRYFRYSDSPHGAGRYVVNTNVLLGMAAASVYAATGQLRYRDIAHGVVLSAADEVAHGNHGYLGRRDPLVRQDPRQRLRIENHKAGSAVALSAIGHLTGDPLALHQARIAYEVWADCPTRACRQADCGYWAADPNECSNSFVHTHCAFRGTGADARERCVQALREDESLSGFEALLSLMP